MKVLYFIVTFTQQGNTENGELDRLTALDPTWHLYFLGVCGYLNWCILTLVNNDMPIYKCYYVIFINLMLHTCNFSPLFSPTMSNAVLICLFILSSLIWHALLSNFNVACFHWCNDFEEFYHTIISAAWSRNYLVFFFFCLILTGLTWLFFFPYLICIHIWLWIVWIFLVFFCALWSVLTNFVIFWCSERLDIQNFLSGLNVFIFKVWGKQKYKHQNYIYYNFSCFTYLLS